MGAFCSDNGVDTVRFRWRTSNDTYRAFQQRPNGTIEGHRGERYDQTPLGRIGVFPDGLVYFEGRAAAILNQDFSDHSLLNPEFLHSAEQVARHIVETSGAPLGNERARLGRVDLAAELRFSSAEHGGAFLHSLASLDVPWCKSRADGRKGSNIETVSFHGTRGHTIYLRAYDKGIESGTAPAGYRLRVERQRRFRKDREPTVDEFQLYDLRAVFVGREFVKLVDLPSATVCDVPEALEVLYASGLDPVSIERLAGYVVIGGYLDYPRATRYRRAAELRSLGISVDFTQLERLEVPVGRYLQALAASWG